MSIGFLRTLYARASERGLKAAASILAAFCVIAGAIEPAGLSSPLMFGIVFAMSGVIAVIIAKSADRRYGRA